MTVSDLITLGIGTPSSIPSLMTFGLGIGPAAELNVPFRYVVSAADMPRVAVWAVDGARVALVGSDEPRRAVAAEARV